MGCRFIHTADWHLGRVFGQVRDASDAGHRAWLQRQRFEVLETIAARAREHRAGFVVVAGDLFESHQVSNDVVALALEKIAGMQLPVIAIPGNHDYARCGPHGVWQRAVFRDRPDNLHLLLDPVAFLVPGQPAVILAAPRQGRCGAEASCRHFCRELGGAAGPEAVRIGLAHANVLAQVGGDGTAQTFVTPAQVVHSGELDYLALGDWHGGAGLRLSDRAAYSGTPEPTAFGQQHAGCVNLVTIAAHGARPDIQALPVARAWWVVIRDGEQPLTLHDADDVRRLAERVAAAGRVMSETLLRLDLTGALPWSDWAELDRLQRSWAERCCHLEAEPQAVRALLPREELEAWRREHLERADPVVNEVLTHLLQAAAREGPAVAERALRQLLGLVEGFER